MGNVIINVDIKHQCYIYFDFIIKSIIATFVADTTDI